MVLNCGLFATSKGHLVLSGDISGCYNGGRGATEMQWIEARDAATHQLM